MTTHRTLAFGLLILTALVAANPATAGCGGDQFTLNFEEIKSECGPRVTRLTAHEIGHNIDAHVGRHDGRYDPRDVVATKISLFAFEEMAGAVRRLVTRAERLTDPVAADDAMRTAENTLLGLPIAEYFTIDDFVEDNRDYSAVSVPFETLLQYLRDSGTPSDLVAAVEDAGPDC